MKFVANGFVFALLYLICMLPTYLLPFLGSNSSVVNALGVAAEQGLSPQFWLHLAFLAALIAIAWLRGVYIEKKWLVIFPVIAAMFDMVPGFSAIPLVPTIMHLLALILGLALAKQSAPAATEEVNS